MAVVLAIMANSATKTVAQTAPFRSVRNLYRLPADGCVQVPGAALNSWL